MTSRETLERIIKSYSIAMACLGIEDKETEPRLVNFIHLTLQGYVKRIEIVVGYYDDNNKWHNFGRY